MMNKKISIILLGLSLASTVTFGQNYVLEQDQRIKESEFYYEHTDLTYFTKSYKNISPFTGYRFIVENKKQWQHYSRFHVGANVKFEGKWGKVVSRNRYEFTLGHELGDLRTSNDNRFRERIKYYSPYSWTKYKIRPNIADEFFFDIDDGFRYTRNRFSIGLGAKIGRFSPELYYFAEFKRKSGWERKDVVGFLVKYKF